MDVKAIKEFGMQLLGLGKELTVCTKVANTTFKKLEDDYEMEVKFKKGETYKRILTKEDIEDCLKGFQNYNSGEYEKSSKTAVFYLR